MIIRLISKNIGIINSTKLRSLLEYLIRLSFFYFIHIYSFLLLRTIVQSFVGWYKSIDGNLRFKESTSIVEELIKNCLFAILCSILLELYLKVECNIQYTKVMKRKFQMNKK